MMFGWLFIILLIAFFFFPGNQVSTSTGGRSTDAIGILRDRYARGEIDSAEYHRRKSELER
ncbi:MAG: SHOCT domain-containing protein [Desulfitobacterium hafniense]|nr:SHOCT domain-containing protein [Desulfitobacterium hafniense]